MTRTRLLPELPPSLVTLSTVSGYTDNPYVLHLVPLEAGVVDRASWRADTPDLALAVIGARVVAGWHDPDGFTIAPIAADMWLDEYARPAGATTLPAWAGALSSGIGAAGLLSRGSNGYRVSRVRDAVEAIAELPPDAMTAAIADWEGADGHCWAWLRWAGYGLELERRCDPLDHGALGTQALGARLWDVVAIPASLGLATEPSAALVVSGDGDVLVHLAGAVDALWPAAKEPFSTPVVFVGPASPSPGGSQSEAPASPGPYRGLARTDAWLVTATHDGKVLTIPHDGGKWQALRDPAGGVPLDCLGGAVVQQGPAHVAWVVCTGEAATAVWQVGP